MARGDAAEAMAASTEWSEMSQWYEEQSGLVQQLGGEYEELASGIAAI